MAAERIRSFLAATTVPHFGINIRWPGQERRERNGHGGLTVYMAYEISGDEAVSFPALDQLVSDLKMWGNVHKAEYNDCE